MEPSRNDLAKEVKSQPKPSESTKLQHKPQDVQTLEAFLERARPLLESVAAKHLTPDRIIKVALMVRAGNDKLKLCTAESLLRCILQAAEIGLEPSGKYGGAYLVPRKNKSGNYEAHLQTDYRGEVELARRSGTISAVEAGVVYEADGFIYERGLNPQLVHRPEFRGNRGVFLGAWAVVFYKDGTRTFEVMRRDEIEAIRNKTPYWQDGPWKSDPDEMAKKTVVRRATKLAPKSREYQRAEEIEDGETVEGSVVSPELAALPSQTNPTIALPAQTRADSVAAKLADKKKMHVVDVKLGETAQEALSREEPPPPTDADATGVVP